MDLTSVGDYLSGKSFSNALKLRVSAAESKIPYRMEAIESLVQNKDIIHFGCADHIEIIEFKIKKNLWFHKRLLSCANKCIGIDNNQQAVEFLKNNLNIPDVYLLDVDQDEIPPEILAGHYDFLVLGEIIEHVDNPVSFLQVVHHKFKDMVDTMIITAPNAFCWNNFKNVFKQTELVNSDHRFWFTPYTLSKVIHQAGYHDINFHLVENYRRDKPSKIKDLLFRRFPSFRDTVLVYARF